MNITRVRIQRLTEPGKCKAVVSITINNDFVIHDIKIIEGKKGLFIAMPSRKFAEGTYQDVVHPINTRARKEVEELILDKYKKGL